MAMISESSMRAAGAFAADGLRAFAVDCTVPFFAGFFAGLFAVFFAVFFVDMWFSQTAGFKSTTILP
jgi:hypothetical protein